MLFGAEVDNTGEFFDHPKSSAVDVTDVSKLLPERAEVAITERR